MISATTTLLTLILIALGFLGIILIFLFLIEKNRPSLLFSPASSYSWDFFNGCRPLSIKFRRNRAWVIFTPTAG